MGDRGQAILQGAGADAEEQVVVLLARLAVAAVLGGVVAGTRTVARAGDRPSPGLRTTLFLLAVLTALVTEVIGTNLARAFGLAGALSVVRFRTVVEDTRDSAFVIFAMVAGMAVGAGYLQTAVVGTAFVAALCLAIGRLLPPSAPEGKLEVRYRGPEDVVRQVTAAVGKHATAVRLSAAGTGKEADTVDLTFRFAVRPTTDLAALTADVKAVTGVERVGWEVK